MDMEVIWHVIIGLTRSERPLWSPHLNVRELIFGRPSIGRSTPQQKSNFWYSYNGTLYSRQIDPPSNGDYRFLLWELIFARPSVGRSYPPHKRNFQYSYNGTFYGRQIDPPPLNGDYRFLLWELIFGRPSIGRSIPPWKSNFWYSYNGIYMVGR